MVRAQRRKAARKRKRLGPKHRIGAHGAMRPKVRTRVIPNKRVRVDAFTPAVVRRMLVESGS